MFDAKLERLLDELVVPEKLVSAFCSQQICSKSREQLLAYVSMIVRWNKVYNLTSIRDPQEMLTHHIFDSVAATNSMLEWLPSHVSSLEVVDVGSGAGLPGVVMAILFPHWQVHCVDAVEKKTAFISQVRAELGLTNLFSHHCRVEEFVLPSGATANLITCRAFASLHDFVQSSKHLAGAASRFVALKGKIAMTQTEATLASELLNKNRLSILATPAVTVPGLEGERHLVIIGAQAL